MRRRLQLRRKKLRKVWRVGSMGVWECGNLLGNQLLLTANGQPSSVNFFKEPVFQSSNYHFPVKYTGAGRASGLVCPARIQWLRALPGIRPNGVVWEYQSLTNFFSI